MTTIACPCQQVVKAIADAIAEFKSLRESCPALRTILIPDLVEWERAYANLDQDDSGHRPILLVAFMWGCLHRLTLPIHKYLMNVDSPRPDLTAQYRMDLQERWFMRPDSENRHKKSKGYLGRLSELLIAQWAENTGGLRIIGLEATGSDHDILTISTDGNEGAIEVKFIGTEDSDFEKLRTMKNFGAADLPTASDYLLTRIYEAAKQLADYPYKKTVIIVIDDFPWNSSFKAALSPTFDYGYADLRNPKLKSRNPSWLEYLQNLKESHPQIESDLASTILSLEERIHIFRLNRQTLKLEEYAKQRANSYAK